MQRTTVFIATSLDGYIARPDGDIEWLNEASAGVPEGEDLEYAAFMVDVDMLVMGRHSYEKVLSFGAWPYRSVPVTVLSSSPIVFPDGLSASLSCSSEPPDALCERLAFEGVRRVYLDGGNTIQRFLAAGLVDDITITVIPVLLGEGVSLFGPLKADVTLRCVSAMRYEFGFVHLVYAVDRQGEA